MYMVLSFSGGAGFLPSTVSFQRVKYPPKLSDKVLLLGIVVFDLKIPLAKLIVSA